MPQDCPLSKLGSNEHHAYKIKSIGKVLNTTKVSFQLPFPSSQAK